MRTAWFIAAIALSLVACGSDGSRRLSVVESSLNAGEQQVNRTEAVYELTESDMVSMRAMARELLAQQQQVVADYTVAEQTYQQAARTMGVANAMYSQAARDYQEAASKFREVTAVLVTAAASDLFLQGVCGKSVSTRQYRTILREKGYNLDGKDIDHIIPRSRGGPDMPWNYNPLNSSINRSLQADGTWWKLMNYPIETLNAWAKYASWLLVCPT